MASIHVAGGVGVAPTEMAAYDAALADANLHDYNLVTVSSIVPADATVERVERAPDLGPAGNRLTVVQAKRVAPPVESDATIADDDAVDSQPATIVAGLGWATGPGPGLFYEVTGTAPASVRDRIREGLDAGGELREWELPEREIHVESTVPVADAYTCVVVLAAYGDSDPIV